MATNYFTNDITAARSIFEGLGLKGERATAAAAFLAAETDDDRQAVVDVFSAGMVRRGLRQIARRLERKDDDNADLFWRLRDDIDPDDGEVFRVDADADPYVAV